MKHIILSLIVLAVLALILYERPASQVENWTDLGFGFRREVHAEPTHGGFEAVMHQAYLFHSSQKLCNVGACSIAPNGGYAIYQDGPSGNLFLFRSSDRKISQLTPKFIALVKEFVWNLDKAAVTAQFYDGHSEREFSLQ